MDFANVSRASQRAILHRGRQTFRNRVPASVGIILTTRITLARESIALAYNRGTIKRRCRTGAPFPLAVSRSDTPRFSRSLSLSRFFSARDNRRDKRSFSLSLSPFASPRVSVLPLRLLAQPSHFRGSVGRGEGEGRHPSPRAGSITIVRFLEDIFLSIVKIIYARQSTASSSRAI